MLIRFVTYLLSRSSRLLRGLLAALIAIQPVAALPSCLCKTPAVHSSAKHGVGHRCCCGCCCGSVDRGRQPAAPPKRSCCQHGQGATAPQPKPRVCKCGSSAPVAPPSVPPQRAQATDDLATSALNASVAAFNVPTEHQEHWAANLPTAFASAADHCISLCKLQF
jgi:hypothetical protein